MLRIGIAGLYVKWMFDSLGTVPNSFPKWSCHWTFLLVACKSSHYSTSFPTLCIFNLFNFRSSSRCGLFCISQGLIGYFHISEMSFQIDQLILFTHAILYPSYFLPKLLVPRLGKAVILETSKEYRNSFRPNVTHNTNTWAIVWFCKFQDSAGLVRNVITLRADSLNNNWKRRCFYRT